MSQFGGGGKPGWARPAGAAQLPGFTGIGGVSSFGMMGVGVPMINQAAFSQPGMLGMPGMLGGAVAAQQQRPAQQGATSMGGSAPAAGKTRTFVGIVTKMHDSYGFVDDDVFFQHSVIRGQHPRVGEKVMVEASYNPQMPFKWNAYRIQLLTSGGGAGGDAGAHHAAQQRQQRSPSPQRAQQQGHHQIQPAAGTGSRWGPGGAQDRHGAARASPPRKRSPPRRSPRRQSPPRSSGARKRSPPGNGSGSRRASPPNSRRNSPPTRKRERSRSLTSKRDSASPPRRRARIIPRYDMRHTKPVLRGDHNSVITIRSRYSKLYVPSDFVDLTADWPDRVPVESSIDMTNPVSFHVWHKDVDFPNTDEAAILEPEDADSRHQVKVLLLAHAGKTEILKKAFGLQPDGTTDDNHEVSSIFKHIQFLVGTRGKETMALGGSWSPSLDGADPSNPTTLIKTAIRTTKALTGVDLSGVPQWYSLVQLRYYRAEKDRVDRVHLLWPDTQLLMPEESWEKECTAHRQQLEARVAAVEALTVDGPPPEQPQDATAAPAVAPAAADVKEEAGDLTLKEEVSEATEEKSKPKPSHWNDLDVKIMKVAELKQELEARGLETRGIKTLLAQRLQETLDKEQELEEDGPPEGEAEVKKEEVEEVMEIDSTPAEEGSEAAAEAAAAADSAEEQKKKAEEYQKKVEALEKEKKDRKASLEKHYALPKEPKIFVYPSKTAKSGKFDCKVTSLYSLLDYRHDDNKEAQFEVSIYAEAFRELIERSATFTIYQHMATAADRETEKKRRDEASKKEKPAAEGEAVEKTEEEKAAAAAQEKEKEKVERIELKALVSNRVLYEACAIFDTNLCSYFVDKDLEELILNADLGVSRGMITKMIQKLTGKSDRLTYRNLTDNLVDSNGEARFEPGTCENPLSIDALVKGFGAKYTDSTTAANGEAKVSDSEDGTVVINGNVINVQQKLALLKKSEQERDTAKSALCEQNSLLSQLKDSKAELEKKKKDLEKELDRTKKKLHDANLCLKSSVEDASHLRSAVSDMRRYADRITSLADKACPPPKKEEKEKKSEEKSKESASSEEKVAADAAVVEEKQEDEGGIPTGLVLSDEAGPEEAEAIEESQESPSEEAKAEDTPMEA